MHRSFEIRENHQQKMANSGDEHRHRTNEGRVRDFLENKKWFHFSRKNKYVLGEARVKNSQDTKKWFRFGNRNTQQLHEATVYPPENDWKITYCQMITPVPLPVRATPENRRKRLGCFSCF